MILSACSFICSRACIAQVEAKTLPRFSKLRINADVLAQKKTALRAVLRVPFFNHSQ